VPELPIAVLGAGPAALSLSAALINRGLEVVLVAPNPDAPWPQTFGMWTDQWSVSIAQAMGLVNPWRDVWDRVIAFGERKHDVGRTYAALDNERVQQRLRASAESTGRFSVRSAAAVGVDHSETFSTVRFAKGRALKARLVFDGTGSQSPFVTREAEPSNLTPVLQTAFGRIVTASNVPFGETTCVLMDWRGGQRRDASFLYALPFGDGRWLFEETSLGRRGGLSQADLTSRLDARLASLGIGVQTEHDSESVSFRMDVPLPTKGQRIVPIGAAAALIHPATGYSIASSFRSAVNLADTAAVSFAATADASIAASKCFDALWSEDRRKARGLETYGLERLLTMDQSDTCTFFDTFFSLSANQKSSYLDGSAGTRELSAVMWNVFRRAPRRLQQRLATGNPLLLARSLLS
jgi:lycopene beta-cyclase